MNMTSQAKAWARAAMGAMMMGLCGLAAAEGGLAACPAPLIEIQKTAPAARVDRSLGFAALAARARGLESGPSGPGALAGLYEPETSLGINFETQAMESGFEHCVKKLSVTVAMEPVIFIASEVPEKSCAYETALAHEMEHHRAAPDDAAQAMAGFARANPPAPGVILARDEQGARQEAARWVIRYAQGLNEAMAQGLLKGAKALDGPQSYEAASRACGKESLGALAARAMAGKGGAL